MNDVSSLLNYEEYDLDRPARHALRLQGFDYAQNGAYFVTICAQNRLCLFGSVMNGEVQPNMAGLMFAEVWNELPHKFPESELDEFVVMPNHLHGIIVILESLIVSLPQIMHWFKTITTNRYIRAVKQDGWESFPGQLWQRGYYDHIIRNERDLERIRNYIRRNPSQWENDENYPTQS